MHTHTLTPAHTCLSDTHAHARQACYDCHSYQSVSCIERYLSPPKKPRFVCCFLIKKHEIIVPIPFPPGRFPNLVIYYLSLSQSLVELLSFSRASSARSGAGGSGL